MIEAALLFWSKVPRQVKLALLFLVALGVLVAYHLVTVKIAEHRGYESGYAVAARECKEAQEAANLKAQNKLDGVQTQLVDQQIEREKEKQQIAEVHAKELAELKQRMTFYVSPLVLRNSPGVPIGYLLFRNTASAFANGALFAKPPEPGDGSSERPSGVSLDQVAGLDLAQADAFRSAVEWGRAWQTRARDLRKACNDTLAALNPQGEQR